MNNSIMSIAIKNLKPHLENPNRMSKTNFNKLVRHIELSGRYEPIVVRPKTVCHCEKRRAEAISTSGKHKIATSVTASPPRNENQVSTYEILNGHHRVKALTKLGYKQCDCVVWDVDDDQARLLLATLNRLSGNDILDKKLALLNKLKAKRKLDDLSKLLPDTKTQIKKLLELRKARLTAQSTKQKEIAIPNAVVFFLNDEQKQTLDKAIEYRVSSLKDRALNKAQRRAQAITDIANHFLKRLENEEE